MRLFHFLRDAASGDRADVGPRLVRTLAGPAGDRLAASSTARAAVLPPVAAPGRGALFQVDRPRDAIFNCGHDDCPCAVLAPRAAP